MNKDWSSDFTYSYLKKLISTARINFDVHCFRKVLEVPDFPSNKRILFLRHDIDIDLEKALQIAMIEKELDVKSTYMVMLNSPCYDITSPASKKILNQLSLMGHEVALHFDLKKDKRNKANLSIDEIEDDILQDVAKLETIIEKPVQSISFHQPLAQFLRGPVTIKGLINAYSAQLMKWYMSDSAGRWRDGEPLPKLMQPTGQVCQLLIHPIWWGEEHKNASQRLEEFFQKITAGRSADKTAAFDEALKEHIGVRRAGLNNKIISNHLVEHGKFDTDASALSQRIESHEKFGNNNLNDWIFKHLDIQKGNTILDLGCGTGKQTIPAAQLTGSSGKVIAIDVSEKALEELTTQANKLNLQDRIITKCEDFKNIVTSLDGCLFDKVIASYSLYYAENSEDIFQAIYNHLNAAGKFFFCGPSLANNKELKAFHNSLLENRELNESKSALFMTGKGKELANNFFNKVKILTFKNILHFDSPSSLYNYWSSYNLYDENIDTEFKLAATDYFKTHSSFETTKSVIGITATK